MPHTMHRAGKAGIMEAVGWVKQMTVGVVVSDLCLPVTAAVPSARPWATVGPGSA